MSRSTLTRFHPPLFALETVLPLPNPNPSTSNPPPPAGIASYEWSKSSSEGPTPEMTGVHTPFLHLSQLEVGDYAFTLTVTDTSGQQDHASVHVFVKEKAKETLKADAGKGG